MKLTQLKYFIEVVDTGSLSAAAKHLNISQPTISVTIRDLEEEIGASLFTRDRNRLIPNDAGTYLYSRVITIMHDLDNAVIHTKQLAVHPNTITVGIPPMIGSFFTPLLLSSYNRSTVPFELNIVEYDSDTLKNMLLNNLIDFAVLLSSYNEGLETRLLFKEDYNMYVSPQNKLRECETVTFDDIKDEPFIVFDRILIKRSASTTSGLAEAFWRSGTTPFMPLITKQISSIKNYVKENVASTVLMEHCVKENDGLVKVNLPSELQIHSSIGLCWVRGRILSENEKRVSDFISEAAKIQL